MKLKFAVCDDEELERDYVSRKVTEWAEARSLNIEIHTFPSAEAFLFTFSEEKDFDILLLDIEMNAINGVELARRVRGEGDRIQIVFITGYPDFMEEGYEVAALHYLMKPLNSDKLAHVLDRAVKNLDKAEKYLEVVFNRETEYIPFGKIRYIEAQLQYVTVYTDSGDIRVKAALSDIERQLDDGFFRCQRSFIINLAYVKKVKKASVILTSGEEIPISRGSGEKIGRAIIKHF